MRKTYFKWVGIKSTIVPTFTDTQTPDIIICNPNKTIIKFVSVVYNIANPQIPDVVRQTPVENYDWNFNYLFRSYI